MSAESPRHARSGGPLTVPSRPPSDRGLIDAVSGFLNDVTLSSVAVDPKDVIQWARFETADINEPTPEGDSDDISPLLLILGYGSGVQVWLIPPTGEAQEVLSWRQGTVRVLRILPTPQHGDSFASKRPLIALCDSASPGPPFCSLSFISIRGGEQVKSIKFKNPILDVLANKRSVVISFSERFAIFDAATLEDRMAVTTCYPCPCPLGGSLPINPLALGDRWLAYADKKLNQSKRSSGGCEGEGVTSYTATVLHAAKSLSKGLRGLGESVAHSLAGGRSTSQSPSPPNADIQQPGVVTILDIEGIEEEDGLDTEEPCDPIVAHFVAHSEAIIALKFDPSGMLLVTADRRGHDFHVFRVHPHPCGPSLAAVHHLYILHRGDTTAKVQDIAISADSRWAAVSTLRGTTHVFAISPYGGTCGVRTHTQPRVVNRLSRFHRSAGLPIHAAAAKRASASPVGDGLSHGSWFPNPRLPPYPAPISASPLAQLRPTANIPTHTITRTSSGRQRLSSLSEDSGAAPLLARARFGLAASGGVSSAGAGLGRTAGPPVAALYLMAANGSLLHLLLHPRPLSTVPKEKICDDSPIELEVEPVAEWPLQRPPAAADLLAPLPPSNPLLQPCSRYAAQFRCADMCLSEEERWLSQVEIVTHAGPHRRLWMGPQFVFKTYNCTGSNSSLSEAETVEVEPNGGGVARSNPVNMPGVRPLVPVFVDSGSASSLEHSPSDSFRRKSLLAETGRAASVCDVQLREDLAEAMREDHGAAREDGGEAPRERRTGVARAVDPLGTVVQPSPTKAPTPDPDPELYVSSNCDEATFRPVVRASAPLASRPEEAAYPLPHTTTIPVQNAASAVAPSTPPDPLPLSTAVVIPAALGAWPRLHLDADNSFNLDNLGNVCEIQDVRPIECLHKRDHKHPPESLPGSNETSSDVHPTAQPRIKRSSTPKSDSVTDSDINSKDRKSRVKMSSKLEEESILKKVQKEPEIVIVENTEIFNPVSIITETGKETSFVTTREKMPSTESIKGSNKETELKSSKIKVKVKTEEQSCNKLSNKPEKSVELSSQIAVAGDKSFEEPKLKLKKRSKVKKSQDDTQVKTDDDTFIEIHAIEESLQPPSDELVSISTPYEDTEPISYSGKSKKSRSAKCVTPARNDMVTCERKDSVNFESKEKVAMILETKEQEIVSSDEKNKVSSTFETQKQVEVDLVGKTREADFQLGGVTNIWTTDKDIGTPQKLDLTKPIKIKNADVTLNKSDISKCDIKSKIDIVTDKPKVEKEMLKRNTLTVGEDAHEVVMTLKGSPKVKKSKSPSPYFERKLAEKRHEAEVTDVYVIDTVKEEFPEIQVTIGNKIRKPQSSKKCQDTEVVEKPVKTWSSIAASKHLKMEDKVTEVISKSVKHENKITKEHIEVEKKSDDIPKTTDNRDYDKQVGSSTEVSLQEKLIELCKRRDIIVAECDAPSESTDLKFIEEHHSVLDLSPLEPLDFCLDDFKLDVMRDSLLDANDDTSPICKINIDSILSTIKDTTSKVTESRAFSLIDLENVPLQREQDFSVIENDNIIMQEVKLDEERDDKEEVMEKSSDDDITSPVVSTDSDKEDKKTGASNLTMPLSKQSSKSKKSRKKKK